MKALRASATRTVLIAALSSLLVLPAAAGAVRTRMHADLPPLGQSWSAPLLTAPRAASAAPTTWCGTSRSTDDVEHQLSDAPRIKVVYALPSDAPDRLAQFADLFQQAATWVASSIAGSAGNLRAPRFDYGIACDPLALDITTIRLPSSINRYQTMGSTTRGEQLLTDVHAAIGSMALAPGRWNYLVYADQVAVGRVGGYGEWYEDDRPGAANQSNNGGKAGIIEIGGGPQVMGGTNADSDRDYLAYSSTHEVGHTLGAVQDSAPHSTGAGHCTDGDAIMCYNDGGPNRSNYNGSFCPVGVSSITFAGVPFDCNSDDYISATPNGYLATHWNIYDSPFMCDVAQCLERQAAPPPVVQQPAAGGGQTTGDAGVQPTTTTPPTTTTSPTAAAAQAVRIAGLKAHHAGVLRLSVHCAAAGGKTCKGTIRLRAGARTRTLHYSIRAGKSAVYLLKPPSGLTVKRRVKASVVLRDASTGKAVTRKITLTP